MRNIILLLVVYLIMTVGGSAQSSSGGFETEITRSKWPQKKQALTHNRNFKKTSALSFYKRKSEWKKIIDSTWGPGLPLAQKLNVFDYYSGYIKTHNPTFTYTRLNWDSVSAYW